MAIFKKPARLGRPRHEPARHSVPYARLQNIFSGWTQPNRPIVKATPANLRRFSKSVYARRAMKVMKDCIATRDWEIAPKDGIELNPEIERQIAVTKACFQSPNNDDSHRSMLEQLVEDIGCIGAGALEHQVGGDPQRPLWMWPVDAMTIQIVPAWDGSNNTPRYWQSLGYGNVGVERGRPLRNDELVYMRSDPSTETPFGLGWVEVAFNTINRILSTADFAGNVAGNAVPANLLMFKGASADDIETVRNYWRNEIEGQGLFPIFGYDEIKAVQLRGTDDNSLFLKYYELLIREIGAASGLSPQNFAVERDVNRDTAEVAEDRDYRQTITPLATLIASYFNREVIAGKLGFSQIEYRILGLDREDELDAAKIMDYLWKNNAVTPNEIRARRNMPPMENEWGDLTKADIDIAVSAARGAKQIDDPSLTDPGADPAQSRSRRKIPKKGK